MRVLRSKVVLLLVAYFAGFATAIYCLAPVVDQSYPSGKKGLAHSVIKSDEFAKSFNLKMRKYLGYSENAAQRAGLLKKKDKSKGG
jgi:flagellar biosynthesis protein FliP